MTSVFVENAFHVLTATAPWWGLALLSFLFCYLLTPVCRALARKLGMVDMPSKRRINTTPVPRGGGLAIYLATTLTLALYAGPTWYCAWSRSAARSWSWGCWTTSSAFRRS